MLRAARRVGASALHEDAEDIVHNTIVSLLANGHGLDHRGLLAASARNQTNDARIKQHRRARYEDEFGALGWQAAPPRPDDALQLKQLLARIEALPEQSRLAVFAYADGHGEGETMQLLGLSKTGLRHRRRIAQHRLRAWRERSACQRPAAAASGADRRA
jgi:DNA-directed RNA polymerase specialized sigma24 family protein